MADIHQKRMDLIVIRQQRTKEIDKFIYKIDLYL